MGAEFPVPPVDALRGVSQRARIAYALCCIEQVAREHHLDGEGYRDWLERAWRRSSAPKANWRDAGWPRNFAEIDALLLPPVGGWGAGLSDLLRRVFELAKETCERAIEGVDDGAEPVRSLARELQAQKIEPPPLARFLRSPATEMAGVGRSVPPGFFREGVEHEDFAWHLSALLRSDSVLERRGAAHASRHLGLASAALIDLLVELSNSDTDAEVRSEAANALAAIATFDEIRAANEKLRDRARESRRERPRAQLADPFANMGPGDIRMMLADPDPSVRMRAIRAAPWIPGTLETEDILESIIELLGDASAEVRDAVMIVLPRTRLKRTAVALIANAVEASSGQPDLLLASALYAVAGKEEYDDLAWRLLRAEGRALENLLSLLSRSRSLAVPVIAWLGGLKTHGQGERVQELRTILKRAHSI